MLFVIQYPPIDAAIAPDSQQMPKYIRARFRMDKSFMPWNCSKVKTKGKNEINPSQ
jgi:hypothetical protein